MGTDVLAVSCSGYAYALDAVSGRERWRVDLGTTFHGEPVLAGGRLIVAGDAGFVFAVELASGELVWQTPTPPPGVLSDLVLVGGLVAGQDTTGAVFALTPETGETVWRFVPPESNGDRQRLVPPATDSERLFVGLGEGWVYAVDAAGAVLWKRDLGSAPTTALVLEGDDLWVGVEAGRMLRLDAASGKVVATRELPARPNGTPVLAGERLLVRAGRALLLALDRSLDAGEGEPWRYEAFEGLSTPRPLLNGDRVLVGHDEGEVVALDLADGSVVWSHAVGEIPRGTGSGAGLLYVGTLGGELFAVRPPARDGSDR